MATNPDISKLQELITALRNETQENSISPENVGFIFDKFLNLSTSFDSQLHPKGGFYRSLFEALPNVHYNESSNYYEVWKAYGGLTDVTEQQMMRILFASIMAIYSDCMLEGFDTRAVIPLGDINGTAMYSRVVFYWCPNLEFVALTTDYKKAQTVKGIISFAGCNKLRKISTPVSPDKDVNNLNFKECAAIVDVAINLRYDLSLADSPWLSYYTIHYMVQYPHNKGAVTVSLHTNVYYLLIGNASAATYEATGHSRPEWMKLRQDASLKNISFSESNTTA